MKKWKVEYTIITSVVTVGLVIWGLCFVKDYINKQGLWEEKEITEVVKVKEEPKIVIINRGDCRSIYDNNSNSINLRYNGMINSTTFCLSKCYMGSSNIYFDISKSTFNLSGYKFKVYSVFDTHIKLIRLGES